MANLAIANDVLGVALVVVALLGMFAVYLFIKLSNHPRPPQGALVDYIPHLRSGDLIIMPFMGLYSWLVRIYGGTMWTHCSLVHRTGPRDEDVNILEIAYYEDKEDLVPETVNGGKSDKLVPRVHKNVFSMPIAKWIRLNRVRKVVGVIRRANIGDEAEEKELSDRLYRSFEAQIGAKINLDAVTWLTTIFKIPYREDLDAPPKKRVFCTELSAKLLQDAGIIAKRHRPHCYRPPDFAYLPEFESGIYILSLVKEGAKTKPSSAKEDELLCITRARANHIYSDTGTSDVCGVGELKVVRREGQGGEEQSIEAQEKQELWEGRERQVEQEGLQIQVE